MVKPSSSAILSNIWAVLALEFCWSSGMNPGYMDALRRRYC